MGGDPSVSPSGEEFDQRDCSPFRDCEEHGARRSAGNMTTAPGTPPELVGVVSTMDRVRPGRDDTAACELIEIGDLDDASPAFVAQLTRDEFEHRLTWLLALVEDGTDLRGDRHLDADACSELVR